MSLHSATAGGGRDQERFPLVPLGLLAAFAIVVVAAVGCFVLLNDSDDSDAARETSGSCGENLTWSYDKATGELTITGTGAMYDGVLDWGGNEVKTVSIGDGVTSIEKWAFEGCSSLASVNIPGSVTSIGDRAFYNCTSLESVNIPNSVTSIGQYAFYNCTSLESVTIGNSVTSIGQYAFYNCTSLSSVTIGNSVTSIGYVAFYNCTSLTTVNIPNSVTSIEMWAFYNCTSLTTVNIPNSVTYIGRNAFDGCASLTTVNIPNSVTIIELEAFYNCTSLESITVDTENGNYSSENGVLFNKTKTTLIQYPVGKTDTSYSILNSVTYIGDKAFSGCTFLKSITVDTENANYSSENGVLFNKTKTRLIQYPVGKTDTSYSILNSVTSIVDDAFSGCTSLTSVNIPNSVTYIGDKAFYKCTSLTTVNIPNSVTHIHYLTFSGCTSLTSVNIPNSVTHIHNLTFEGCTSLTSITVPNSVTSIAYDAFSGCTSLTAFYVDESNESYASVGGVLFNKDKTKLIKYPAGKKDTSYEIPGWVTSIGDYAFDRCTSLISVNIPSSVTSIGSHAFEGCTSLTVTLNSLRAIPWVTAIIIGESVTTIEPHAFERCTSLTSVTIGNSVTSIGYQAFRGCTSLTSVILGNAVTTIEHHAFADCTSLTSITIPASVTSIGFAAFDGQGSLTVTLNSPTIGEGWFRESNMITTIIIGESVTSIANNAFRNCNNLTTINVDKLNEVYTSIDGVLIDKTKMELVYYPAGKAGTSYTIPDSVTSIGDQAFYGCTSLTSVTLGKSVTSFNYNVFSASPLTSVYVDESNEVYTSIDGVLIDKTKMELVYYPAGKAGTSYTIPDSVTSIGSYAFYGCRYLTSVTIPDSVTSIAPIAFAFCFELTSVNIPNSVTSIGTAAFSYTSIASVTIPDSVTTIAPGAFLGCPAVIDVDESNETYALVDGVLIDKSKMELVHYPMGKNDTSYTIPDSITSIGDYAFYLCPILTSVTIPDSVTSIGSHAFYGCTALTSVTIDASITISQETFVECTPLREITITGSPIWEDGSISFSDTDLHTIYIVAPTGYKLPISAAIGNVEFVYDETYTVSFDANGGTGDMADISDVSGMYALPDNGFTAPAGKEFKCWSVNGTEMYPGTEINVTENVSVRAVWKDFVPVTYTVSFDANGGTGTISETVVNDGSEFTLPSSSFDSPAKGDRFIGWAVGSADATPLKQPGDPIIINADTCIYAVWETPTMTVTYNGVVYIEEPLDGEKLTVVLNYTTTPTTVTIGDWESEWWYMGFDIPDMENYTLDLVKTYEFTLRYGNADGTLNITTLPVYTVTFDANGGTGSMTPVKVKGDSYTLPANGFTAPSEKQFKCWSVGGVDKNIGDTVAIAADLSVIAVWMEIPVETYTVSFNGNGGTGLMDDVTGVSGQYKLPANGFTAPSGKQFKCWSVNATEKNVGESITVTSDTTVTAVWMEIPVETYTVSFNGNGGTGSMADVTGVSGQYTLPENGFTAPSGKQFKCWSVNNQGKNAGDGIIVTGNMTIVAVWEDAPVETYTVSFDANGGTGDMAAVNGISGMHMLPANGFTAPAGKEFKCWSVNGTELDPGAEITVTADIVVKAIWKDVVVQEFLYEEKVVDGKKIYVMVTSTDVVTPVTVLFDVAKTGGAHVDIKADDVSISFDIDAVNAIGGKDVTLKAVLRTSGTGIENAQAVIEVTLSGSTFENGKAKVTVPFNTQVPAGKVLKVYYVDGNTRTEVESTYDNGQVTFTTNHFSTYAIVFEDVPSSNNNGGEFPIVPAAIGGTVGVLALAGAAFFVIRRRA